MAIEGELYGTSLCGETFLETSGSWVLPTEYSPTASSPVGTVGYELLNAKWGGLPPPNEKLRRAPTIVKRVSHSQYSLIGRTRDVVLDEFAAFHKTLMPVPPAPTPNKSPPAHSTPPAKPLPRSSICESAAPPPPQEDLAALAISDPIIPDLDPEMDADVEDNIPTRATAVNTPAKTTRTRAPRKRQSTSLACGSSQPPAKITKSRNKRSKGDDDSPNKRRKNSPSRAHSSIIKCTWSNCPRTFTRTHDRLRHIDSVHVKGKPFLCQYCPAAYARKDALQRHLTTCALNPDPNKAKLKPNTSAGKDGLS